MKKNIFKCLLFLVAAYGIYCGIYAWDRRADGFTIEKIHSDLPYNKAWNVKTSLHAAKEVNTILGQSFFYLGRGFQCYAFLSQDGKYVLKFLRHQRLRPPVMFDFLPNFSFIQRFKERKTEEREKRLRYLFRSFKVAYENVPEETGLLYVHLNKTIRRHPHVVIFDRCKTKYEVALDDVEFVVQRRAFLIKPTLTQLMQEGKVTEAQERISQIFQLLAECAKKGVLDMDGALIRKDNLGFLEDRAIYIDAGKLACRESIKNRERFRQDLHRLRPLYKWLSANYPPLASYFEEEQKRVLTEF